MRSQTRAGFTLIELMVSMALTLVLMSILAQAFVLALETFSSLKGIGDMQQNLRTATTLLRSDLGGMHFEGDRRLSDPNIVSLPPQAGFFVAQQGSAPSTTPPSPYLYEGQDRNGMPSFCASNHWIYCTVKRIGNRQESFFTSNLQGDAGTLNAFFQKSTAYAAPLFNPSDIPPTKRLSEVTLTAPYQPGASQGFYGSQWAEVLYYLQPTGLTADPNMPNSYPTFSLYRAQFGMVADGTNLNYAAGPPIVQGVIPNAQFGTFANLSCSQGANNYVAFNSPMDAAKGLRNYNPTTLGHLLLSNPTDARLAAASTLVLPNVISFQVQLMQAPSGLSFSDLASPNLIYDTASFNTNSYNNNFGLKGIQVTLRVWDINTRQTRQVTVAQDF